VTIISRLPNGDDIPTDVGKKPKVGIEFPGVSPDGSRVLMTTPAGGPSKHLYMAVDDSLSYEISQDENGTPVTVQPLGMVRDGTEVLFATKAQITSEDNDTSTDIYKWDLATEKATLLTRGPTLSEPASPEESKRHPIGSTDACAPVWEPAGCDAVPVSPDRAHPNNNAARGVPTAEDDLFAENNGDVYFYSPEQLDPAKPGVLNQRNLYVYRDGGVHLVATLEPSAPITRLQISPDGGHAAFVTKSKLTSYDNQGFAEMYTYDPGTDDLLCASCNPTGAPPVADVLASQGGRFMADDGRAFFATKDALVPRDQNGKIIDVYEFSGGRPQLITSGLGSRDFTGGSELLNLFFKPENTGLEAVSHDGTDVYFSTFETLVGADHNGQFVKFYDARTGGGFPEDPKLGPCAAADECHGADSSQPPPPTIASGEAAAGGNLPRLKRPGHHKKKHRKKGRRHHARHNHG
jgi:hypothetical protein